VDGAFAGDRTRSSRINFKQNDAEDLIRILPLAIEKMKAIITERGHKLGRVSSELSNAAAAQIEEILNRHQVTETPENVPENRFRDLVYGTASPSYTIRNAPKPKPPRDEWRGELWELANDDLPGSAAEHSAVAAAVDGLIV
jgi:hypothetical protein